MPLSETVERYLAFAESHERAHEREGLRSDQIVYEQQTEHPVCGWCGYCEGGCS